VNLKSAEDDSTPLHLAAVYGREDDCEMIKYLLDHGADVNAVDLLGATPLADAASHGLTNIMALLVKRGADINGGAGWSAVHAATECNSIETMRFLIARGGDVNMVSAQGLTPLSLAARVPGRKALLQLLLAAGAVHNGEDDWDRDMARRIHASARYRVGGNVAYDMDKLVIQ
jgi:ankyrin repeat protein